MLTRILLTGLFILLVGPVAPARAETTVCGPITSDTVWTSAGNNYVITCNVIVQSGVTLAIQTGTVVKFNDGTSLQVEGALVATGTTFTSSNASPGRGNWGRIFFTATSQDAVFGAAGNYVSGSKIEGSTVQWGGGGSGVNGQIETASASPFLYNNTIRNSGVRGVYAIGRSSNNRIVMRENAVSDNSGGGIYVTAGHLKENTTTNNSASLGGGIYAVDSHLENNQVSGNSASQDGGGIYATGSDLIENTVSGNAATYSGGGIYSTGGTLTNNTVTGSRVVACYGFGSAAGGGIHASGGSIVGNTVSGNSSAAASGLFCSATDGIGGGIYASLSTVTGNTISDNTTSGAQNAYGGGVYSVGSRVSANTIAGNTANASSDDIAYGGGLYTDGGVVSGNTFSANSATGGQDSQGGGIYGSLNTISNNTLTGNSANRGSAIYAYKGSVIGNTVMTNTASWCGSIYVNEGTATSNFLHGNSAVNGGGLCGYRSTLVGNIVEHNTANIGAGILAAESTVHGNTLTGNAAQSDGGGIYAESGTVTNNTLTNNSVPAYGHGSGAYITGTVTFSYNSVLSNTASGGTSGGVSISGQLVFQYNNLYGNQPYDAEVVSSQNVTGTLNYWGQLACTSIPARIYDGNDAPGRGTLSYAPSLYSPAPVTQLTTPQNLTLTQGLNSVTLSWSPIPAISNVGCRVPNSNAPDLVYRVYYDTDNACGPYDGKGLPAGDSPITVGTNTQVTLLGASPDRYVFVVAAHDYLGRESAYSNLVGNVQEGVKVFLPLIRR